jgi:perosamine synthetase
MKISLAAISMSLEARVNVMDVLTSGDIGQNSPYFAQLEAMLCAYTGAKHCILTSSGTMADAVAVAAMKIKYNPKRVILPALTFIAQANAVYYNGLDIEFVDVTENFTMDWAEADKFAERTSVFFPSDCLGRIGGVQGERIIEDACEAFGSQYEGIRSGMFGEIGTFSFFVSHAITTGEGGAIITDDYWLADLCRSLRSHGRASDTDAMKKFSFPFIGFNGKMTAPQAAIGCGVMEHVDSYIQKRHDNYVLLQGLLGGFAERVGEYIVPHGFPVEFTSEMDRDSAMRCLLDSGIECRKFFSCIPTMEPAYAYLKQPLGRYPHAEHIAHTHLYVPCHQNMTNDNARFVADKVLEQKGRVKH